MESAGRCAGSGAAARRWPARWAWCWSSLRNARGLGGEKLLEYVWKFLPGPRFYGRAATRPATTQPTAAAVEILPQNLVGMISSLHFGSRVLPIKFTRARIGLMTIGLENPQQAGYLTIKKGGVNDRRAVIWRTYFCVSGKGGMPP